MCNLSHTILTQQNYTRSIKIHGRLKTIEVFTQGMKNIQVHTVQFSVSVFRLVEVHPG